MKPTVQDEDMEDDLAAEEENKLINEVGFPDLTAHLWDLRRFALAGVQNMVSGTILSYNAANLSARPFSPGRRTHPICMI